MDALHPRLLVTRFAETFRVYDAVGPSLRTAHVRDPEGTLIELQSY